MFIILARSHKALIFIVLLLLAWVDCCKMILIKKEQISTVEIRFIAHYLTQLALNVLLLVICNSVKMGIHLCYKWEVISPNKSLKLKNLICFKLSPMMVLKKADYP